MLSVLWRIPKHRRDELLGHRTGEGSFLNGVTLLYALSPYPVKISKQPCPSYCHKTRNKGPQLPALSVQCRLISGLQPGTSGRRGLRPEVILTHEADLPGRSSACESHQDERRDSSQIDMQCHSRQAIPTPALEAS